MGEGTGLGLAVVPSVVRGHRGAIAVRSRPGQGTTFELFFPVHAVVTVAAPQAIDALPRGRGQRILLVDDERAVAGSVKLLLERLGYRAVVFNLPDEALAHFWSAPASFDAAILDYQMPGMTGVTLAGRLLAHRPGLPVLIASGFSGAHTAESLRELGIAALIPKPIELPQLAAALAQALPSPPAAL